MPRTKPTFAATIDVGFVQNTTGHGVRVGGGARGVLPSVTGALGARSRHPGAG